MGIPLKKDNILAVVKGSILFFFLITDRQSPELKHILKIKGKLAMSKLVQKKSKPSNRQIFLQMKNVFSTIQ